MKYFVWKKRFIALIGDLILVNVVFIAMLIFFFVQNGGFEIFAFFGIIIVIIDVFSLPHLRFEGSVISFEDTEIKCVFLKKVRRVISYNEIKDIGIVFGRTVFQGRERFIYISRFKSPELQVNNKAFIMYRKTKDVIVVQHNDKIIDLLKNKCPDIAIA